MNIEKINANNIYYEMKGKGMQHFSWREDHIFWHKHWELKKYILN